MKAILDLSPNSWNCENTPSIMAKSMFYYIQSAGHFYCQSGYYTDRLGYDSMLLIYTSGGRGCLKYRGNSYELAPNQVFLIDCMEHQFYGTAQNISEYWDMCWLHFNGCESRNYAERIFENSGPVISLEKDSVIPSNINKILKMLKDGDKRLDIIGSCLIVEMLTEMLLGSRKEMEYNYMPEVVQKAVGIIEGEYNKDINLDTLSNYIGVSKYHLSRLFKKHTGYSPYEYLLKYRLNQGKNLLKNTEMPVIEISECIGFGSVSNFIKVFKGQEGVTPLTFRGYWR